MSKIDAMFIGDFKEMVKAMIGEEKYSSMEKELRLSKIIKNNEGVTEYKNRIWDYLISINEVIF